MNMEKFIEENRRELTICIRRACPNIIDLNDEEIEMWIINDEGLYNWAMSEGVEL